MKVKSFKFKMKINRFQVEHKKWRKFKFEMKIIELTSKVDWIKVENETEAEKS